MARSASLSGRCSASAAATAPQKASPARVVSTSPTWYAGTRNAAASVAQSSMPAGSSPAPSASPSLTTSKSASVKGCSKSGASGAALSTTRAPASWPNRAAATQVSTKGTFNCSSSTEVAASRLFSASRCSGARRRSAPGDTAIMFFPHWSTTTSATPVGVSVMTSWLRSMSCRPSAALIVAPD